MQEQDKQKLLLLYLDSENQVNTPLEERYQKILSSICDLEVKKHDSFDSIHEEIKTTLSEAQFLVPSNVAKDLITRNLSEEQQAKITVFSFGEEVNTLDPKILQSFSCFQFDSAAASDLVRILYQHFSNKKSSGTHTLMEKGSLILGEKLQGLQNIGMILDQLYEHLTKSNPSIIRKFANVRQLITAMCSEAIAQGEELAQPYPTVDIQFSSNATKACFAIRFPIGNLSLNELISDTVSGKKLSWHLGWRSCDFLLIKDIAGKELEVKGIIFSDSKAQTTCSLLTHKTLDQQNGKNLLSVPSNYSFALINEIKTKKPIALKDTNSEEKEDEAKKNIDASKENQIKSLSEKVKLATKELSLKKNEVLKLVKDYEAEIDIIKKKNTDLQKKADFYSEKLSELNQQHGNEAAENQKASSDTKVLAKEIQKQTEKIQLDEKRYQILEQKYANAHKESLAKDKEIAELKAEALKNKREAQKAESIIAAPPPTPAATAAANQDKDAAAKIREFESKEAVFKQEIRKLNFKLEASEKNVKALKDEHTEKLKLMEKKVEAGKLKEVELLKKIDELGAMLKKMAKAA